MAPVVSDPVSYWLGVEPSKVENVDEQSTSVRLTVLISSEKLLHM